MAVEFRDRAVLIDETLVLADLHLGRGAATNAEFPIGDGKDVAERFAALLDHFDPTDVVIAGDFLHSFDSVPRTVEETVASIRTAAGDHGVDVVVTPGNHDAMLDSVWDGRTTDEYRLDDGTVVLHGHEKPETTDAPRYVVGHDHPTIEIEGKRRPCYLLGDGIYRGSDLLMVPTFSRLPAGVRVNDMAAADFMSPLVTNADALRPVVRDEQAEETLRFPPLGSFRRML